MKYKRISLRLDVQSENSAIYVVQIVDVFP